jgi:hypothetical protein
MPPPIIPYLSEGSNQLPEKPVIRGLTLPIIDMPNPTLNYPVIDVPTQEEFDAAVKAEQKKKEQEQEEKSRGLPDSKPILPQVQVPVQNTQDNRNLSDQPTANSNLGVPEIQVPFVGPVPVPPKEQVILAGTTATASVAAALVGKSLVEWMVGKMKPIVQQLFVRGKKLLSRDLTPYELQVYFAFEKSQSLKKVNKLLKKEQKAEKKEQYKKFHSK